MAEDELDEKCGYYGEKLVLYLQSIGLGTCWVGMFKISMVDGEPVITADGKGPFIKVDLGIVKYHFEVGYGK